MPLDAICISALREELCAGGIIGQRIDKIQQPERDVVILTLRGTAANRLLISSGTNDARVHFTSHQFENPAAPPMFCMLLRKHITGARIAAITQPPAERLLTITLETTDAMGDICEKRLILELMGRFSNIILTDSDGIIIDCQRRIAGDLSSDKRQVLPGLLYRTPPVQEGKIAPLEAPESVWDTFFDSDKTIDKRLLEVFSGLSPLICRELSWRAYGETDFRTGSVTDGGAVLRREFCALTDRIKAGQFEPWILTDDDSTPRDFSYMPIYQYEGVLESTNAEKFSEMLESFYTRSSQRERVRQRASATAKLVRNARDRLVRKLTAQKEELLKTENRDVLRECGDIITANLHRMQKGAATLEALDFFSGDGTNRTISLNPLKTPQQNAAKYYKDYTKAKNANKYLTEQLRQGEYELQYLESVLEEIALAEGERDLSEIRRELTQTGYIKAQKKKEKQTESKPMRFCSSTGLDIYAGRNNTQNDTLTLKAASKTDIWLHTQKIHGSHVIISSNGTFPDETSLYEAAAIAAYYSSARSAGKVPVDYCLVKYVKKQPGGRPGMVIYTDYKTIIAQPDEELIKRIRTN